MAAPLDFRSFGVNGPTTPFPDGVDRRWWTLDGDKAARSISSTLQILRRAQEPRFTSYTIGERLYGNAPALGYAGHGGLWFGGNATLGAAWKERITFNVVQSAVDTVTSKIAKNKPRPFFLPSGGNYRTHRRAKKLNKFVDGMFYENRAYDLGPLIFRDGAVWGDGLAHVYERNKRVHFERVPPHEVFVDELEALLGQPRQMHRVKFIDRETLAEWFPDHADQIRNTAIVKPASVAEAGEIALTSDLVCVRESWHLRSGPEADDGAHVVTVEELAISKVDKWEHDFFPFARFRWCPRLVGYWSQGLAEQLRAVQLEINKLMQVVQRSHHLAGTYKVMMPLGSKVPKEHINNAIGTIIEYAGDRAPTYITPPIVPPEIYEQIERHIRHAYEIAGVSQLSAGALKPAGLDSKVALREYSDIESDRFRTIGHEYETFFLDLARIGIALARSIAKRQDGKYKIRARGRGAMREIDWKEIALDDGDYGIECFPISSLPRDPAGRLQTIQEYAQAGYLTPRQARRLLDFPDLEAVENLANAAEEYIEKILDGIVDDGEYTPPDERDDLAMARELALQYLQVGKANGLEPERLDLLVAFLDQITTIENAAAQKAAGMMPGSAPGGAPMAPTAPPVPMQPSDLVQNTPIPLPRAA